MEPPEENGIIQRLASPLRNTKLLKINARIVDPYPLCRETTLQQFRTQESIIDDYQVCCFLNKQMTHLLCIMWNRALPRNHMENLLYPPDAFAADLVPECRQNIGQEVGGSIDQITMLDTTDK